MPGTIMNPFKPLVINVEFEDREYGLGDVIDLTITLVAKRGMNIRGMVAELICEERWSHSSIVRGRPPSERTSVSGAFVSFMIDNARDLKGLYDDVKYPKTEQGQWNEVDSPINRQQRYVLGTTYFGQNTKVKAGTTTLSPQIKIPTEPPPHAAAAQIQWTLRVRADIVWGRDIKAFRAVQII